MKRILVIIGLVVVLVLPSVFLSCGGGGGTIKAAMWQEFTLPVGQTVEIDSEGLTIKFVEVISDSRCAIGVECPWAGEAKCNIHITIAGSAADMVLTQLGGSVTTDYFINYKITFKLEPYPEMGKDIAPADYKLVMTVIKT
jgi:hypothetical protein